MKQSPTGTKIVPDEILAEAAKPAFERIRVASTKATPVYEDLLEDMRKHLLDPDVKMSHLWDGRRLDPSGHTGRVAALLGAPPWSYIRQLRIEIAARLLRDKKIADVSGTQIAFACGFKSYNALNEAFKDWSGGITATGYRTIHKELTSTPPDEGRTVTDIIKESLGRVDRLTVLGEIDTALSELDHTAALVADQGGSEELTAEVSARRGFIYHRSGEFRLWELDLDNAYTDLEKARAAYDAAGGLPLVIRHCRKHVEIAHDTRLVLSDALCDRCAAALKTDTGRTVREHLYRALGPVPRDLQWFQICCDPCYRVVWEAISKARLGLVNDAWKAFWLAVHINPVEDLPPSLARYVRSLYDSELLDRRPPSWRQKDCHRSIVQCGPRLRFQQH